MVAVAKKDIVLKVEKLKKAYGPATIVEGFDLKVAAGEDVALTGRNGAGKSTVLRCLVGADRPDEGTVEVLGVKMKETSPEIRRNVATVIDDLDFFPDLSVVEHLDLLARAHGIADPDDLVDEILEEVQLVPQAGQLPDPNQGASRQQVMPQPDPRTNLQSQGVSTVDVTGDASGQPMICPPCRRNSLPWWGAATCCRPVPSGAWPMPNA